VSALALGLLSPVLFLLLLLWMERVERALPDGSLGDEVLAFLDDARPDEVEELVVNGLGPALDRYWRRRRLARLLPGLTS
jgi:hypothetical protein